MSIIAPKAFISFASEDRERFALDFAARLRKCGVDARLDLWEIRTGESLIQKIFEMGVGYADVFIVVLSSLSVQLPWVRELDPGVVERMEKATRLMLVVIEECETPPALGHLWGAQFAAGATYDEELKRVVEVIFEEMRTKGLEDSALEMARPVSQLHPDLRRGDSLVLAALCAECVETGLLAFRPYLLMERLRAAGLSAVDIDASLKFLDELGFIKVSRANLGQVLLISVSTTVVHRYLGESRLRYKEEVNLMAGKIVNERALNDGVLRTATGLPEGVVRCILRFLESEGFVELLVIDKNAMFVKSVSARLRRLMG